VKHPTGCKARYERVMQPRQGLEFAIVQVMVCGPQSLSRGFWKTLENGRIRSWSI